MSVPFYLSNPQSQSSSAKLASDFKMMYGCNVSQELDGEYYIEDKDTGVKVKVEDGDTIWTLKAKFDDAIAEKYNCLSAKKSNDDSDNVIKHWHDEYEQKYDETTEKLKEAKKKDSWLARLWKKAKNIFNGFLKKNDAKKN